MSGKFEGLINEQWEILEPLFPKIRWKVEGAIAWLQRKYRRLVVRWERHLSYWKGFLNLSLIFFWLCRFLG